MKTYLKSFVGGYIFGIIVALAFELIFLNTIYLVKLMMKNFNL